MWFARKENEGTDLDKVGIDCDAVREKLRELANDVNRGTQTWPTATQPEVRPDYD